MTQSKPGEHEPSNTPSTTPSTSTTTTTTTTTTTNHDADISASGKYAKDFHIKANPGDKVLIDFKTFTRDSESGYQNTGIWVTDSSSKYGASPKLLYTRGATRKIVTVGDAGDGIYVYIFPYGPDDEEGSAYGGTWELTMTQSKPGEHEPSNTPSTTPSTSTTTTTTTTTTNHDADISASGKYAKDF